MPLLSLSNTISPYDELLAFEYLYAQKGMSLKRLTEQTVLKGKVPSEAVLDYLGMITDDALFETLDDFISEKIGDFSIVVNNTPNWPKKLSDSHRPTPVLYYRGDLSLIEKKSVAVVGARNATKKGLARASKIAKGLVDNDIAVVTGLAKGIDTAAATAAIDSKGITIGVIGTPIDETYPKENAKLQDVIATNHLLISQVPFYRYSCEPFNAHKVRFPERNELMASITNATVIVEASDTSGTLTQARACINQKRPLFLMKSLLENKAISWPEKFIGKEGVYILEDLDQLLDILNSNK